MAKKSKKQVPPTDSYVPETPDKDSEQDAAIAALEAKVDEALAKLKENTDDTSKSTASGKVDTTTGESTEYHDETEYIPGESGGGQGSVPTYPGKDSEGPAPEPPVEPDKKKELPPE